MYIFVCVYLYMYIRIQIYCVNLLKLTVSIKEYFEDQSAIL